MLKVLIDPNTFFSELSSEKIDIKLSIGIMLVVAFGEVITTYVIFQRIKSLVTIDESYILANFGIYIAGVLIFIIVLFIWIIMSALFYLLSKVTESKGSFKRMLEFISYGFLPQILVAMVTLIIMVPALLISQIHVVSREAFEQQLISNISMTVLFSIELIFLIWSCYIWIFAVKHARMISAFKAVCIVAIPLMIYVIYIAIRLSTYV